MTTQQAFASDPANSVWVSASAGTGKTKVLTDRVLRLMLDHVPPSKILCLTFTKAAANEMANRINDRLGKWAMQEDHALAQEITALTGKKPDSAELLHARRLFCRVLDTPDRLKIQTIHSFCQSIMQRFPLEAGIAPHFRIIDDRASAELLEEARLRLLNHVSVERDKPIAQAVYHLAWLRPDRQFSALLKEIISHRSTITSLFNFYGGINGVIAALEQQSMLPPGLTEEKILRDACRTINSEALREAGELLLTGTEKTDQPRGRQLLEWLALTEEERIKHFSRYSAIFLKTTDERRLDIMTKNLGKKYPSAAAHLSQEQERIIHLFERLRTVRMVTYTSHLLHISEGLLETYRHLKALHAYLDYDDLILMTTNLLDQNGMNQWILYKLDEGIDHILLDEAQDTSPNQWQIIRNLCDEFFSGEGSRDVNRTIFVVGDEKQSIYSFQGADPAAFHESHQAFLDKAQGIGKDFPLISLDRSFRSTEAVLTAVDHIFSRDDLRLAITSAETITHYAHRSGDGGHVQLWPPFMPPAKDNDQENWKIPDSQADPVNPARLLAETIASTINEWLIWGKILPSKGRPINAGDILILVQRRKDFSHHLVAALKSRNIAVAGIDRLVLTDHLAVMDLMALGRFLLLPQDDLTLAALLKSPLIGLNEEALFELAYDRGNNSLWQRLNKNDRYKSAYDYLSAVLAKADFCTPFELYSYVIDVQDGRNKLCSRMGQEANDPLDEFLSLALAYEQSHIPSLQGFLHWLEAGKIEVKRDLDQGKNQVRIMTVHGAKGLQAPIVFLPDTMQLPDSGHHELLDDDTPLLYWAMRSTMNHHSTSLRQAQKARDYEEYIRLLYVALTRAEDTLIIGGYSGSRTVNEQSWYYLIKQGIASITELLPFAMPTSLLGDEPESMLHYSCAQKNPVAKAVAATALAAPVPLPDFLKKTAPEEPLPPIPLAPSTATGIDMAPPVRSPLLQKTSQPRGILIHRLLQVLPGLDDAEQPLATAAILRQLPEEEAFVLANIVQAIMRHPDFAAVFTKHSKAEVPVTGIVSAKSGEKRIISGRIDRLAVTADEVLIVDYKSNRLPSSDAANTPISYLRQMAAYRSLLMQIYPGKTIKCGLLWTEVPMLMPIDSQLLE